MLFLGGLLIQGRVGSGHLAENLKSAPNEGTGPQLTVNRREIIVVFPNRAHLWLMWRWSLNWKVRVDLDTQVGQGYRGQVRAMSGGQAVLSLQHKLPVIPFNLVLANLTLF